MKPYYTGSDGRIVIYHGDAREVMPELSGTRLVVADAPYSFGMASTAQEGKAGGWGDLMNAASWYATILRECHRLTANHGGAAWVFNSWRSMPVLARAAYEARWAIQSLLVWDKEWIGTGHPKGLRSSYELVALFAQPEFTIADRTVPDIWRSQWASQRPHGHPAEKPVALMRRLIAESGGGPVLDPFCGSGTTLVAAKELGQQAVGIEIEERWAEVAAKRLDQEVIPMFDLQPDAAGTTVPASTTGGKEP